MNTMLCWLYINEVLNCIFLHAECPAEKVLGVAVLILCLLGVMIYCCIFCACLFNVQFFFFLMGCIIRWSHLWSIIRWPSYSLNPTDDAY
jgi:hypothetical protein